MATFSLFKVEEACALWKPQFHSTVSDNLFQASLPSFPYEPEGSCHHYVLSFKLAFVLCFYGIN